MYTRRSIALSAALVALAGCGGGEEGTPSQTALPGNVGSQMSDAGAMNVDNLVTKVNGQIEQQQEQLSTLKASASEYGDKKLDELIASAESKLKAISAKLAAIKTADGGSVAALQSELKTLLAEGEKLYGQAQARLTELAAGS